MLTFWPAVAGAACAACAVGWAAAAAVVGCAAAAGAAAPVVGCACAACPVVGWAAGGDVGAAFGLAVEPAAHAESNPAAAAPKLSCKRWRRLTWFMVTPLPDGTSGLHCGQRSCAAPRRADS